MAWAYDLISRTTIDSNRNPNVSKSFRIGRSGIQEHRGYCWIEEMVDR